MSPTETERVLCKMYRQRESNQRIMLDYTNKRDSVTQRLKNLRRQYQPLDIMELCRKHGI